MTRLSLLAAAVLLAVPLSAARAQPLQLHARTAGELAEMCSANPRAPTGPAQLNYCDGFAQGAVDVEFRHAGAHRPFCFPPNMRRDVTLHEFAHWVRMEPSRASENAVSGLFQFLAERYPCH